MIEIGATEISLTDFETIVLNNKKIKIHKDAIERVRESFDFINEFAKNRVIYGINTGFGPMAQHKICKENQIQLQYNLIRSHSAGSGDLLDNKCVKAAMIARLNTLLKGYSGVNDSLAFLLKDFINNNIFPNIYKHGGVGASGDLVQLSHLALALIGEGEVTFEGRNYKTSEVFQKLKLKPIAIKIREGLALINGTSVMTGINLLNVIYSKKLLQISVLLSSIINEIVESYDDHFSEELNNVKFHDGQKIIAKQMREILKTSKLIKKRNDQNDKNNETKKVFSKKVQEYYSLRCVPQILGPVYDTLKYSEKVLINEINSVNDNPIVDAKNKNVFHGGNFHGDYVSLEADKIKIAVTKLSMLAERQLNYLMNHKLNEILPPFINLGKLGLNLGMQGMQFTAVSTVAENQTLSNPMSVHSIPNNNDNQDVVSMGTNATLLTKKVVNNTFEVLAIEAIAVVQAIDYLGVTEKLSKSSKDFYDKIRKLVPKFIEDTVKYPDTKKVAYFLKHSDF